MNNKLTVCPLAFIYLSESWMTMVIIFIVSLLLSYNICTSGTFTDAAFHTIKLPIQTYNRVTALHLKKGGKKKKKVQSSTITVNKLAYRNYEVLEKWEAGISLVGTEVKSIRDGKMNIRDGFVKPNKNGRSCT